MEGTLYVSENYSHFEIVDPSTGAVLVSFDGHEKAGKCFPGDTVVWKGGASSGVGAGGAGAGAGGAGASSGGVAELQLTGSKRANIIGTLELTSKTIHGHTKKGVPMYIFTPYSKEYPPFVVASSEKNRSVNLLCSVNFLEWKTGSPMPRGSIQKVFGPVGRLADEMNALLEYVAPIKQIENTGDIDRELIVAQEMVQQSEVERGVIRKHLPSEFTFNIDPEGCRDIDDVITLIPVGPPEDNKWRLIVSIADVSSYVPDMGAIDNIAEMIGQSVYDDTGRVIRPMLPAYLSEGRCSLIQGATRRTISAEVVCGPGDNLIAGGQRGAQASSFYLSTVCNGKSYTYDTVDDSIRKTLEMITGESDTHNMVASLMIWYNTHVAKLLYEHKTGIFRGEACVPPTPCHDEKPEEKPEETSARNFMHGAVAPASYFVHNFRDEGVEGVGGRLASPLRDEGVGGMQASPLYCHSTSPLRRYCDLINQRLLKHILLGTFGQLYISVSIRDLNAQAKRVKKYEKYGRMLKMVLAEGFTGVVDGTRILDKKVVDGVIYLKIWIEDWKTMITARARAEAEKDTYELPVKVRVAFNINGKRWKEKITAEINT